jgi:hypothetical protein
VDRRDLAVQHRCVPAAGPYQVRGAVRYGLSGKAWNLVIESTTRWPSRTARTLARRPGRRRGRTSSARCMGWRAPGESGVGGAGADGGGVRRSPGCGSCTPGGIGGEAQRAGPQGQMVVKLSPVVQCPKPMGFMICHSLVVVGYN